MTIYASRYFLIALLVGRLIFVFAQHEESLKRHVGVLSSNLYDGRLTGSIGQKLAAIYIQEQFDSVFVNTFSLNHLIHGGTIVIGSTTLNYKKHFFYSGFDSIFSANYNTSIHKTEICFAKDLFALRKRNTDTNNIVVYLIEDWVSFKDLFGHEFKSEEFKLDIKNAGLKEVFIDKNALMDWENKVLQLNFIHSFQQRQTENLICPVFWRNENKNTVIFCAHYDHLGTNFPGADDNASGVSLLLELAKLIKQSNIVFNHNIVFVFFSAEEQGLFGSEYFVNQTKLTSSEISLCINFDMLGFTQNPSVYLIDYTLENYYEHLIMGMNNANVQINWEHQTAFLNEFSSDHIPFVNAGIPSLMFFCGLHENYHSPKDTLDTLDFKSMNSFLMMLYNNIEVLIR